MTYLKGGDQVRKKKEFNLYIYVWREGVGANKREGTIT
jgi:hypothetical protein